MVPVLSGHHILNWLFSGSGTPGGKMQDFASAAVGAFQITLKTTRSLNSLLKLRATMSQS